MDDGIGLTKALLGLDGFQVLDVTEGPDELVVTTESTAVVVGCSLRHAGPSAGPDVDRLI